MSDDYSPIFTWVQSAANSRSCPGLPGGNISNSQVAGLLKLLASIGKGESSSSVKIFSSVLNSNVQLSGTDDTILHLSFALAVDSTVKIDFTVSGVADSDACDARFSLINELDKKTLVRTGCYSGGSNETSSASFSYVANFSAGNCDFSLNGSSNFPFNIDAAIANNSSFSHARITATVNPI